MVTGRAFLTGDRDEISGDKGLRQESTRGGLFREEKGRRPKSTVGELQVEQKPELHVDLIPIPRERHGGCPAGRGTAAERMFSPSPGIVLTIAGFPGLSDSRWLGPKARHVPRPRARSWNRPRVL